MDLYAKGTKKNKSEMLVRELLSFGCCVLPPFQKRFCCFSLPCSFVLHRVNSASLSAPFNFTDLFLKQTLHFHSKPENLWGSSHAAERGISYCLSRTVFCRKN